jgi:hypothetical protein
MKKNLPAFLILTVLMLVVTACSQSPATNPADDPSDNNVPEPKAVVLGNTPGNIVNGGMMCGADGSVYFRSEADNWRLYKARPDGCEKQKVSDDMPSYLNVAEGWIYYSNFSDGHKLYKMKTDGTSRTKLTDCQVSDVNVINNHVYYVNWDNTDEKQINVLYRMDTGGQNNTVIDDGPCSSVITDGEFLYVTRPTGGGDFSIFRMNLDGSDPVQLNSGHYSHFPNICGEYIFYWSVGENRLRRMQKDGSENVVVGNMPVDYVNAWGNHVYFSNAADRYNIYRIDTGGTTPEKLTDIPKDEPDLPGFSPNNIYVIDGYVYYRGFHSEETGDALFVVKPGANLQEVWDGKN